MYNVLFVDDDQAILEGLDYIIDWASYDIEICGHAYDGMDGIRQIEALAPDILISDIRMPGLSGLDMIEHLLFKYPRMKIIILSGYDDFSYAQKAIELGVFAYILKPVRRAELCRKMEELTTALDAERDRFRERQRMASRLNKLSEIARDKYFADLVMAKQPEELVCKIDPALMGLDEWPRFYCLFYIELDYRQTVEESGSREKSLLTALEGKDHVLFSMDFNHYVLLAGSRTAGELESSGKTLLSSLENTLHFSYYCGISLVHSDIRELPSAFEEAKEAMGEVFSAGQAKSYQEIRETVSPAPVNCSSYIDGIVKALRERDESSALQGMDKMFKYLAAQRCRTSQFYTESINFLLSLKKVMVLLGLDHSLVRQTEYLNMTFLQSRYRTLTGLKSFLLEMLAEGMDHIRERPVGSSSLLIDQVKQHIRENRTRETRESLADRFHITPAYLSRLFKAVTGTNLIDYMTRQKIEEAKTRLLYSSDQIQEIADHLGYANAHYFTKVFEKQTGTTPSRYRKMKGAGR